MISLSLPRVLKVLRLFVRDILLVKLCTVVCQGFKQPPVQFLMLCMVYRHRASCSKQKRIYLPCDVSVASSMLLSETLLLEFREESVLFEDEGEALVDPVADVGGVELRLIPSKRTSSSSHGCPHWMNCRNPDGCRPLTSHHSGALKRT